MDDLFQKAKAVLLHPNFNKLSPQQIQQVFKSILASGLTKDDIQHILTHNELMTRGQAFLEKNRLEKEKEIEFRNNMSRLEKLPKDIFKHLVEKGEIKGKDLVYLCNSSPVLREHCLANSYDVNGQLIETQVIYRKALERVLGKEEAKKSSSPAYLYNRLVNSYTVTVMSKVIGETDFRPLESPKYVKQIAFSKNTIVILNHFGMVDIRKINNKGFVKNDLKDIKMVAVTNYATLCLDENNKLWFVGNINQKDQKWDIYFPKPIEVPNNFKLSTEGVSLKLNIKDIKGDSEHFYILTEEGDFYRVYYGSGTSEVKIDYFFIVLVESRVESFYMSQKLTYTVILKDGYIKTNCAAFRDKRLNLYADPDLIKNKDFPVKAMAFTQVNVYNGENFDYIFVLDNEHNLSFARTGQPWISFQNVARKVSDFDVMQRNGHFDTLYFIGSDKKLYQCWVRDLNDADGQGIFAVDVKKEDLPKITGSTKIQIRNGSSFDGTGFSDIYLFKPVF